MSHLSFEILSLSMLLNEQGVDYEGGDFEFNGSQEEKADKAETKKGRIVDFPSYMLHGVNPIISGVRKSLVVWVQGPKFR